MNRNEPDEGTGIAAFRKSTHERKNEAFQFAAEYGSQEHHIMYCRDSDAQLTLTTGIRKGKVEGKAFNLRYYC